MRVFFSVLLIVGIFITNGQSFSEDKNIFRQQAIDRLQSVGTEPARKIAFDFRNAWDGKFTSKQQDQVHQIALKMQREGYRFYPYFYHFFSYLAYSVAQENLKRDELDKVLDINGQMVKYMPKSEYKEFLFGLNIYFARRYLSYDHNLYVQAPDGTYSFELLDEVIEEDPLSNFIQEETVEEDTSDFLTDEQIAEQYNSESGDNDNWGSDTWGDDDWGSNDDWGASDDWGTNDDWAANDDSWENDPWSDNDSGGSSAYDGDPPQMVAEPPTEQKPAYSPLIIDHLKSRQLKYGHPSVEGPVINLSNTRILMTTPYDSVKIKNVNGSFLLKNRMLVAGQGTVEWPGLNKNFRGATVQLKEFHIKKDRSDFWTPNATLSFSSLVNGSVPGIFEYKSTPRPKRTLNNYPVFTSNTAEYTVKLSDKVTYTGGIQLKGNELFGTSVSKETGTLKILDGRGNTIILRSKYFSFKDSLASMGSGSFTLLHGSDSIYHKSVKAKYDIRKGKLTVLRNSNISPYYSTYFGMHFNVDLIEWNTISDSVTMEIMNAKDLLPATFESHDFFNMTRFSKLGRYLQFHPISAAVNYANKYDVNGFYAGELAMEYGIDERFAKAAGKLLSEYGFAEYNRNNGFIKLYENAFIFYDASAKKIDYDNLMIPSKIKNGHNATLSLDSGKMYVRGVSRFYITSDYDVFIQPYDSTITLLKNRNILFDGVVHTSDFEYQGRNHEFNYQEFLFQMPQIDSMRLTVPVLDTASQDSTYRRTTLENQITGTEGTLFIDEADNKSGKIENSRYPFFSSDAEAVVYFDGKEVLNGAYDKSVRFIIPPFKMDSIDKGNSESISFEGSFNSGGIFPTFPETLSIQPDGSMGFVHQIPEEGYNLYGTAAKTYEEIELSNKGMRGYGKIDFLTTTVFSDDFIYYPDSVTADGSNGIISPGSIGAASYPEAVLGNYDMYWLPRKDSMYLRTVYQPFEFYNSTAKLTGEANITTKGVYGSGAMLTRGSKAISKNMHFQELSYNARHAKFEVLTNDPLKPAMAGDDIRLEFDLTNNTALVQPEQSGVAAISFPYSQMKTSITEARWDLQDSTVTMTKPPDVPLEDSYFFSTRSELDSLAFNANKAIYDINSQELKVEGIPFIVVADAKIIPKNNETIILANSELEQFKDAEIIMDTVNGYHYLDRATITILSRNKFEGNAWYRQIVANDTFDIRFDSFELQEVPIGEADKKNNRETKLMTVSGGEVDETDNFIISPGFKYKGNVIMYAAKEALELDGSVKLILKDPSYNKWIYFKRSDENPSIIINHDQAVFENGFSITSGIHLEYIGNMYTTFVDEKISETDFDFFKAKGLLTYEGDFYKIETQDKSTGVTYEGSTMHYYDSSAAITFEGPVDFIDPTNEQITAKSSAIGRGTSEGDYETDAMMVLDFSNTVNSSLFDLMAEDLIEVIERTGPPVANELEMGLLIKIANIIGDESTKYYEEARLKDYTPLVSVSKELDKSIVISGVKMVWDKGSKAWYNSTKLGISNIRRNDINAKLDGFLEITKDDGGNDKINLFIQAAPGTWYYFGYSINQLVAYSSNSKFNEFVSSKSNVSKAKPGELVLVNGDENETLSFINEFREKYFGITEPYNLIFPDQINFEEEDNLDTIKEEDDGFGFD